MKYLVYVFVLVWSSCQGAVQYLTVDKEQRRHVTHTVDEGLIPAARVIYDDKTLTEGWAYLEIGHYKGFPDNDTSYNTGLLEGIMTVELIYNAWRNTMKGYCEWKGEEFCKKLRLFLAKKDAWMSQMIQQHSETDPIWYQIKLIMYQLEGLIQGYDWARFTKGLGEIPREDFILVRSAFLTNSFQVTMHGWQTPDQGQMRGPARIVKKHFFSEQFLLNLMGDLEDLESVIDGTATQQVRGDGHCSALIKLLPGNTDLYTSHVTWNSFESMLRLQKKVTMPLKTGHDSDVVIPGHTVTYSSYPGILHSADDFYLLSSGLATMETTIGNSNPDLWVNVTPEGEVFEWIRTLVANRLASSGKTWTDTFKQYNSGTYNNQWMIVDYKLFTPRTVIKPDTLWVLEQLPGLIVAEDQSQHLRQTSYWPSYNVPFYSEVFNASGIPALVEQYGDWFSYDKTARALIFERDHEKVKDLDSMVHLMRYNDFKNDPLSVCDCTPPYSGENAISARNDLNPSNGTYPFGALGHRSHAGTDVKVTSYNLFHRMEFLAINGPTNEDLPVFQWSKSDFNASSHFGHPDIFDFPLVHHQWKM